jgi:hypothetical protein
MHPPKKLELSFMSLIRVRAGFLATAAALVTLSACSMDSPSSPKPLTAPQLAAHYDSLALADTALGFDIALFNGVIASGQLPSSIQMRVGGTTQTWNGVFANILLESDSLQLLFFWPNTQVSSFVGLALVDATVLPSPFPAAGVVSRGGDFLTDSINTFTGSFTAVSGACSFSTIVDTVSFTFVPGLSFPTYGINDTCSPAVATVTGTIISEQGDATASAALQSLAFTQQTINGVRLVLPPPPPPPQRVPGSSLRAAIAAAAAAHGQPVFFRRK